eukprot:scpid18719/ scgid0813/ Receptor tyrosine-protein kinase erbB-3; Glial growth factor receptor; Proto-oncogene-like protein c-ErbB-3
MPLRRNSTGSAGTLSRRKEFLFPGFILLLALAGVCDASLDQRTTCTGATIADSQFKTSLPQHTVLKNRYSGCQVVLNNLIIENVEYDDMDYSFLNTIEEVHGFVWVFDYKRPILPLQGLKLIRGRELYQGQWAFHIGTANNLVTIEALSLKEISAGAVNFNAASLPSLCYVDTIDWRDLLNTKAQYSSSQIDSSTRVARCSKSHNCSDQCQNGCWDNKATSCFIPSRTSCSPHCGHRCFGNSTAECCHDECASGCTGNKATECLACRHYANNGTCVSACPPLTVYDPATYRQAPNPNVKYVLDGTVCVPSCPDNRFTDGHRCVQSCGSGKIVNGSDCLACDGICPKTCNGSGSLPRNAFGQVVDFETNATLERFRDCTHIKGYLKFSAVSWFTIKEPEQLQVFKDVKTIDQYIFMSPGGEGSVNYTTLDFLDKLEAIRGTALYASSFAVYLSKTPLLSLNLRSLTHIGGSVVIQSNSDICYVSTINSTFLLKSEVKKSWIVRWNKNVTVCEIEGHLCDPVCDPVAGCWGSGPTQCIRCLHKKVGNKCIDQASCPSLTYDGADGECLSCHEECAQGCTGPGSEECSACKNYKDGPYCVGGCPGAKFPDSSGTCTSCSPVCKGGCTGGSTSLGTGGCNQCYLGEMDENGVAEGQCLDHTAAINPTGDNSNVCDKRYLYREPADAGTPYAGNWFCRSCSGSEQSDILTCLNCTSGTYQSGEDQCLPCHAECASWCTGPGNSQCGGGCKNILHNGQCVSTCPESTYASNKLCHTCHALCDQCSGPTPSDCATCRFHTPPGTEIVTCTCPPTAYFDNVTDTCKDCHMECRACPDASCPACTGPLASQCSKCKTYVQDTECVASCREGYALAENTCNPVTTEAPEPPTTHITTEEPEEPVELTSTGPGDPNLETVVYLPTDAAAEKQTSAELNWIPLVVAGCVLVMLVAAIGFMLYKRQEIMAKIRPAASDDSDDSEEEEEGCEDDVELFGRRSPSTGGRSVSRQRSPSSAEDPEAAEKRSKLFQSSPSASPISDAVANKSSLNETGTGDKDSNLDEQLGNDVITPPGAISDTEGLLEPSEDPAHFSADCTPVAILNSGNVHNDDDISVIHLPLVSATPEPPVLPVVSPTPEPTPLNAMPTQTPTPEPAGLNAAPTQTPEPSRERKSSWREVVPFNTQFEKTSGDMEESPRDKEEVFNRSTKLLSGTPEPFSLPEDDCEV